MKQPYIIEVVIPLLNREPYLFVDPQVRDQRLREMALDLFNRFGERVHILKRAKAVSLLLTEGQAGQLTWHPDIKTIRPAGDDNA